jgi:hypothetical protein
MTNKEQAMKKKEISTDTVISQIEEIVASDIDGETVMMSIENGKYYGMDDIGSRIWELIEKPIKVSDLIATLLEKFDVDRETCERDVPKFLNELNEDKILAVKLIRRCFFGDGV